MGGALVRARAALRRQAWGDACSQFGAADVDSSLEPADLEAAALAAYLIGRDGESESLWARAHQAWLEGGDRRRAARCAFWLALPLLLKGEAARGGGWLARGSRLLDGQGSDCAEIGLLLAPVALRAMAAGDLAGALETTARVEEIGESLGDPDVLAFGRLGHGQALIALGKVEQGMSLLDEAMVAVTADDVSPIATGLVYCAVLVACQDTFDFARAEEWTAVLARWCDSQQDLVPFRGECLVHRAEVLQLRGEWSEARVEAKRACDWLAGRPGAARAHYRLGELHRLGGELTAAARDYRAASAAGHDPQPGCALLRLMQGHSEAASALIERAVENARDGVARARVLPALVEIALARQDDAAARNAADELCALAAERGALALHGIACLALGTVLLAEGDARASSVCLRECCAHWEGLSVPYEVGRARVALALACRELGDDDSARLELDAARIIFDRLGAVPDRERVDRLSGTPAPATNAGLTSRELEVLALVAAGHTNREIAAALCISPHTVRRHLQNSFRKLGVPSRAAATAFVVQHELVPDGHVVRTHH